MEYVYTALLLHSTGQKINEDNVKKVLTATGAKIDEAKVKALVSSLEGVDIEEVLKQAALPVAPVQVATKEEKVVEKKAEEGTEEKEKKAEEAASGLASLFG